MPLMSRQSAWRCRTEAGLSGVTTKQVGEGTGLGLAVCRGLVESAGGEIGVDPSYESGARFYVLLPLAQ